MFIGHFALAYAAKKVEPRTSLAAYLAAAQLPDLVWPVLVLGGAERVSIAPGDTAFTPLRFEHYPWSHSLLMVGGWAALAGILCHALTRRRLAALLVSGLALSHWLLDFVTHRPDMPVLPWGGPLLGLGLWNSVAATLAVELALFAAGLWLYLSATRPVPGRSSLGIFALTGFLLLSYAGNVLGPPPPSVAVVAWVTIALMGLFPLFAWADRARRPAGS